MTLAAGARLGSFEILGPLGAGGMGEVYRARDLRLGREVALKVLPAEFATDPGRLKRFEKEARGASALNHPAIVTIYEVGAGDSVPFIAMELVTGKTLREVLLSGPLPMKRLLAVASQIAEGLAAAHEAGIVHRDLKPENVMIPAAGGVKILDFGLAKLTRKSLDSGDAVEPTMSRTEPGGLLGTVSYMSPEQAAGQTADFRSDQFSMGSILYEMATGKRAFQKETAVDTLAAILHEDPAPMSSLRPDALAPLVWVVERCLAKDPADRYHSTADFASDLVTLRDRASTAGLDLIPTRPPRSSRGWIAVASILAGVALLATTAVFVLRQRQAGVHSQTVRFSIPLPAGARMANIVDAVGRHDLAVSPDGTRIAFAAMTDGVFRLWVRPLDSLAAQPLSGTDGARCPFWSPDGHSLAFFAEGKLKKIAASGGPSQALLDVPSEIISGTWSPNGTILIAQGPLWAGRGLYTVPASGGRLRQIPVGKSWRGWDGYQWPHFLPDGRHFLVFARRKDGANHLLAGDIDSAELRLLEPLDSRVEFAANRLFYVREGTLVEQPFDASRLRFESEAVPLVENVPYYAGSGWAPFSVSRNGVLAYQAGRIASSLHWLDRQGRVVGAVGPTAYYGSLRLSPDGRRAAVERLIPTSGSSDMWIEDLGRAIETRFTSGEVNDSLPAWSPDGRTLAYLAGDVYLKKLGDVGPGELLLSASKCDFAQPADWSPDGRYLLYSEVCRETRADLWLLPLTGDRKPVPFRKTEFSEGEGGASFSPDGKWIAYLSDESGRLEVYVSPFAGAGLTRISTEGAAPQPPRWRRDGRELFYLSADHRLVSVPLSWSDGRVEPGPSVPLFPAELEIWNSYDVAADGQRFLVNPGTHWETSPITVALQSLTP